VVPCREIAGGVERGDALLIVGRVAEAGVVIEEVVEELFVGVRKVVGVRMFLCC